MGFYTYMWLRENGTPYYIGKGSGRRAYEKHQGFNPPKSRARIPIQCWADEEAAFEMEKWYIKFFGRKDNGTGILRNHTDGGEGVSGIKFPEGHAERQRAKAKGRKVTWGHKISAGKLGKKRPDSAVLLRARMAAMTSEQRSRLGAKARAAVKNPVFNIANLRSGLQNFTPEQRSDIVRRGHIARKKKLNLEKQL